MTRSIFGRNTALLIAVILAGQAIAGLLVHTLVIGPQTERVASVTADTVAALSTTMTGLTQADRDALIARLDAAGQLLVRPLSSPPPDGHRLPSFLEISFMQVLADRLGNGGRIEWRTDTGDRLWLRLNLGAREYWVSLTPPRQRSIMTSLLLALFVAFVVASVAGLVLQRWIDRPLRRLARAVDGYDGRGSIPDLSVGGGREVASVAGAFGRLAGRLEQQEADRALMLAGVSHDLRTPLTRLRLSIELMHDCDPDLLATAVRQTERMEAMLGQFLDFARGFETEPFETVEIAGRLRTLVADMAWDELVSIDLVGPLPATTRPEALDRAVANLLANAIRHGGPDVRLTARRVGRSIEIRVVDGGPGIAPESLAGLLRPFAKGGAARGRDGTGLGLAITEQAVRALGGSLRFKHAQSGFAAIFSLGARPANS